MEHILNFDQKLGSMIRYYRKLNNYNQKQLAYMLKITPQQLQKYEKGKNKINFEKLLKISRIFGISLNDFANDLKSPGSDESKSVFDKDTLKLVKNYSLTESKKLRKLLIISSELYSIHSESKSF